MKTLARRMGLVCGSIVVALLLLMVLLQGAQAAAARAGAGDSAPAGPAPIPGRGYLVVSPIWRVADYFGANDDLPHILGVINTADDSVYQSLGITGQLGTKGGGVFDVDVSPDGRTALVSNFGDSKIIFVDISNPVSARGVATVTLPMFAEDIDITADGRFALVTDGGFSTEVAVLDMASHTLVYTGVFTSAYSNAVAVAPDGTVVVADYFQGALHTLVLDETGVITHANTYTYAHSAEEILRPVNIGIAPDHQTVVVCDAATTTVVTYRITGLGELTFSGIITGAGSLNGDLLQSGKSAGVQSVAFNEAGDKAYLLMNGFIDEGDPLVLTDTIAAPNRVGILDILGPGQVSLNAAPPIQVLNPPSASQLFGVDTLAVAGNKAYVSYPTLSGMEVSNPLTVIDLDTNIPYTIAVGPEDLSVMSYRPVGVTAVPLRLELQKTTDLSAADLAAAHQGDLINIRLSLANPGPQLADIKVQDILPAGLSLTGPVVLDPPAAGVVGGLAGDLVHGLTISAGQQVTISYTVQVGPGLADGLVLTSTAQAESPWLIIPAQAAQVVTVNHWRRYLPFVRP